MHLFRVPWELSMGNDRKLIMERSSGDLPREAA